MFSFDKRRLLSGTYSVKALNYLAKPCEHKSVTEKASENYKKFLEIWNSADPEILSKFDVRQRLDALKDKS